MTLLTQIRTRCTMYGAKTKVISPAALDPDRETGEVESQNEPQVQIHRKFLIVCRETADRVWEQEGTFTMHTAQLTPTHSTPGSTPDTHSHPATVLGGLPELANWKVPGKPHTRDLDALIHLGFPEKQAPTRKAAPLPEVAFEAVLDATPGIFLGLRLALMFNAGLGVAALVLYEGWMMVAR